MFVYFNPLCVFESFCETNDGDRGEKLEFVHPIDFLNAVSYSQNVHDCKFSVNQKGSASLQHIKQPDLCLRVVCGVHISPVSVSFFFCETREIANEKLPSGLWGC